MAADRRTLAILVLLAGLAAGCKERHGGDGGAPAAGQKARRSEEGLRFGLTLSQGGARSEQVAELATYLGQHLGEPVVPVTATDYASLASIFNRGELDVAWLPPLEVARVQKKTGGEAVLQAVRRGSTAYAAGLFVLKNGGVQAAEHLRWKTVAWVDRHSAAGYLFARDWLLQKGLGAGALEERFLGSHRAACQALVRGEVAAAATWMNPRATPPAGTPLPAAVTSFGDPQRDKDGDCVDGCWQELGEASSALRLLVSIGPIPNDALVASKRLARGRATRLVTTLRAMHREPRGRALLRDLFGAERLEPADPARKGDYQAVARVHMRLLAALGGARPSR